MILNDIKSSYILARKYVERCCIKVVQNGVEVQAFTECEGKMRVTDWGGTSSAIYLLNQIDDSGTMDIKEKLRKSSAWLLSNQASEGSWEAAEMQCCEATSAVLYDLNKTALLDSIKLDQAIKFIQSCFKENSYFLSRPNVQKRPHIYTTYLAVRALNVTKHDSFTQVQKQQVINWIKSAQSADEKWGPTPQCIEGDVAHTVFAILTLYYCGVSIKEIKKTFRTQIKWLRKQITVCATINGAFSYEATEAYVDLKADEHGEGAYILKSYHFNTALLCELFLKIEKMDVVQRIIKKLIVLRGQQEGWGITTDNKIFVWATQQAIDCMYEFEKKVFRNGDSILGRLKSIIYSVPYFIIKFLVIIVLLPIIHWLCKDAQKGADIILGIIMLIIPWLIKRSD